MTAPELVYDARITMHYRGALNRDALERAVHEFVRRHEILRTTFASVDGDVVQVVHDKLAIQIPFLDLSNLPEEQRERDANRAAVADAMRPFDSGVGPLIRVRLVKMEAEYYRLYVTGHHIIFDRVPIYNVLLPQLAAIYKALAAGEIAPVEEPQYRYSDLAPLGTDSLGRQIDYWREQLAGELPDLQLPTDRPRPAVHSYRGNMKTFALPAQLTLALKAAATAEDVTPHMFLLAVFKTLLHRYSGQEDVMVGGISGVSRWAEFQTVRGNFSNFFALRTHPAGDATFREYLAQVKDSVLGALANCDAPWEQVIREVQPRRESSRRPFFQATFSMEPLPAEPPGDWHVTQMDTVTGYTNFDLSFAIEERANGLFGRFDYSTALFDDATIERMKGHWLALLDAAVVNPAAKLCDLTMMTPEEEHQLRAGWNDTAREIPHTMVHELIERQASLTPDAIAVEAAGEQFTYRELNERANRLARRLREAGVTTGTLVALCVGRTVDTVAAPLAVLKAGGSYLPLDAEFPKDRLAFLMEDAEAPFLLTVRSLVDRLPSTDSQVIYCEDGDGDGSDLLAAMNGDVVAYVLYTSGSTGRPKGVGIHHRALVNLLLSMQREPGFTASDSLLAVTTLSFDIAELEIYLPLISGGRVVIASHEESKDLRRLSERLRESKCTVLQATPAAWRGLIEIGWEGQSNLKGFCGGEALARDLAEDLLPRVGELWNLYGPTETTVWSTVQRVKQGRGLVPIGQPIDNTEIYVLDGHRNLAPIGVAGEICIGGAGVARGYVRREELTAERFIENPFRTGTKLYRTGDLGRRLADGTLECLGRIDNQIKIRGFRIEPGEIEAALLEHRDVRAAAVRVWPDASGSVSIIGYVTGAPKDDLRRFLQQKLPDYMIPARFVTLDALPLTPNGKVDRQALPKPSMETAMVASTAPRNVMEHRLVAIWESVLGVRPVGIDDDFFDLGGHSFQVAKLLRKIEVEFGARLSMAALFEAPTVSLLSKVLRDSSKVAMMPRVATLQPGGVLEPIFWVHGGPLFRPLAASLGSERPFLGVSHDRGTLRATFEEYASQVVETIRAAQPNGPYHLGGWCISGLLAYEAAAQLIEMGETVALVVMLDAINPSHYFKIPKYRLMADKAAFHLKRMRHKRIGELFSYAWKRSQGAVKDLFDDPFETEDAVSAALYSAVVPYNPKRIAARVLAVQPAVHPESWDLRRSWAPMLDGDFGVVEVPGDHLTMFQEPNVGGLAACIKRNLRDNVVVELRRAAG